MAIMYHNLYGSAVQAPVQDGGAPSTVASNVADLSHNEGSDACHLYSLPNELILHILSLLHTAQLLPLTSVSHRVHALTSRILHARLLAATHFPGGALILECYPPSQKLTAPALDCLYTGTPGIETCLEGSAAVGKLDALHSVYSRFQPQRREWRRFGRNIPGDIPGSRTHPTTAAAAHARWQAEREEEKVKQILSLEGHELFIQLEGNLHLVRKMGFLQNLVPVHEGYVRIWRDWLGRRAGADVAAQLGKDKDVVELPDLGSSSVGTSRIEMEADKTPAENLHEHESILWLDGAKNVGLRVNVREKKWRRHMPVLIYADEEVSVSYEVVYEELFVRTAHLVLTLERSAELEDVNSGKAVVFGSFR